MQHFKQLIRNVPDFPKKGILFYDITTLLKDGKAFAEVMNSLADRYRDRQVDLVVGIESRGFIFGSALALQLKAGFVPVRKPKKLPAKTLRVTYDLEYGQDSLEIHEDAIQKGQRVLVVDDLLATGGTAAAVLELVRRLGGEVVGVAFLVELEFLNGRKKLPGYDVYTMLKYQE
ncbi:MAG TPA: adenine phosphoribosyltransferase [Terriglobia bacterium]|nr:adenine phosphoribosyltransferase [Terriglobia bacterium]